MSTEKNTAQHIVKVIGEATAEQIAQWKAEHKDVYELYAVDPDTKQAHKAYIRNPKRKELSYATQVSKNNPFGMSETILKECWLGGSKEVCSNDAMFMGVSSQLDEIIQIADASIKKL